VKKTILFEDAVMYYNKWVQGIASRDISGQKVGIKDILKKNEEHLDGNPNFSKSSPVLPFPIDNTVSLLGDLSLNTSNALALFRQSLRNPVVKKDKALKGQIILIITALKSITFILQKLFQKIGRNI